MARVAAHSLLGTAFFGVFTTKMLVTIGPDGGLSFAAPASPGTYEFFCVIHPSMTGQLVVS